MTTLEDSGGVPIPIVLSMAFILPVIVYAFPWLVILGVLAIPGSVVALLIHDFVWWPSKMGVARISGK